MCSALQATNSNLRYPAQSVRTALESVQGSFFGVIMLKRIDIATLFKDWKDHFYYKDGALFSVYDRIHSPANSFIGSKNKKGYLTFFFRSKNVYVHRVIFFIHNGYVPDYVDHEDGDRRNNWIDNLRECDNSTNMINSGKQKGVYSSEYKGVSSSENGKWVTRIGYKNKILHLGTYADEIDAARVYNEKASELFGDFALLNDLGLLENAQEGEV